MSIYLGETTLPMARPIPPMGIQKANPGTPKIYLLPFNYSNSQRLRVIQWDSCITFLVLVDWLMVGKVLSVLLHARLGELKTVSPLNYTR